MLRNKSRGSLEIPKNASSYRGCQILKASTEKMDIQVAPVDLPTTRRSLGASSSRVEEAASFNLNDSILMSPEKCSNNQELDNWSRSNNLNFDCPKDVTDCMKSHYITAMKDLRKGFLPVCSLVECAADVIVGSSWNNKVGRPEAGVQALLRSQRFWVSDDDLKSRYNNVESVESVTSLAETAASILSLSATSNKSSDNTQNSPLKVVEETVQIREMPISNDSDPKSPEAKEKAKKEKERYRLNSKRCRRYHFQILLRLAVYRALCNRDLAEDCRASPFFHAMRSDIVVLVRSLAAKEKYDYIWRFMESEIEYTCGTDKCVQRIMNAVCDELIIPLPEFTDSLPKRPSTSGVRRSLLQKSSSSDQTSANDNFIPVPPRRMPSQNGLRLDNKHLLAAQNQNSPFGRHRFQRQRSSIECAPPLLQRSNSSSQLPKTLILNPEHSYERTKRALAPMGNLSQPPQKVIATEENRSSFTPFSSQPPSTPTRMASPPPPSPRGTPYRETQLRLAGDPNLMPSPGGPSAILTQWSPFHKQSTMDCSSAPPGEPTSFSKTRRQLQF